MIQPLIKTLFGDSDTATDADAMENFLFHKVVCAGSADAQNILNLINRIGSLIKLNCVSGHRFFGALIHGSDSFFKRQVERIPCKRG